MGALAFNHFNIRAPKPLLEEVRTFYVDVVGLTEGFRPAAPVPGYWLYLEALPILHLMEWGDVIGTPARERGYLDHVAFACDDLEGFIAKLKTLDVGYTQRDFDLTGGAFTQLELTDPVGTGVELNFGQ